MNPIIEGEGLSMKRVLIVAGLFTAALGVVPAGALTVAPTAGTEELCPATKPLTESEHKHEASVIRAYLGCRVSDDPGPSDPGKR
jgi:hypothetical protein